MPVAESSAGPDLVLAGAARSGTSSLAAQLGTHPDIDPGKIKESNYFSRAFERGPEWYEGLYVDRRAGLMRLDASTSYTSPRYPDALSRLTDAVPDVFVIYAVRQPTQRAISHYLLRRHYFQIEPASDFGAALRDSPYYIDTSDYSRWIPALTKAVCEGRLLVVPFELITSDTDAVIAMICEQLGLAVPTSATHQGERLRNNVVEYRSQAARRAARRLRRSPVYPRLRHALGAARTRKLRGLITRDAQLPTTEEAMASCDGQQLEVLRALDARAGHAVSVQLADQDRRLGLDWLGQSFAATH